MSPDVIRIEIEFYDKYDRVMTYKTKTKKVKMKKYLTGAFIKSLEENPRTKMFKIKHYLKEDYQNFSGKVKIIEKQWGKEGLVGYNVFEDNFTSKGKK